MENYYKLEIEIQKQKQQLALLNEKKREREIAIAKIKNMYPELNRKIGIKKRKIGELEGKKYSFYDLKNLIKQMEILPKHKIPVFYCIVNSEFWKPLNQFLKTHFYEPTILKPSGFQVNLHYTLFYRTNNGKIIYSEKKNDFTVDEVRNSKSHDKNEAHFIFDDAFALCAGIQKEMANLYPMTPELLRTCELVSSNSNFKSYQGTFNVPLLVYKGKTTINDMLTKK